MGCGGSRTDALEPRYLESWTKETESTWLTSTDTDIPLSSIQHIPSENSPESAFNTEKSTLNAVADFFDDGFPNPAQAYLKVCSVISDPELKEMKSPKGNSATSKQQLALVPSVGTTLQKRSVLHTEETKWQSNQMSTKQVTITVTKSIRQIGKSGKILETSHTTFELMKPPEEKGK
ncbi:brain and acute leukemia cytoplasmic protein-like [Rhinatrema bivittatum]|uniref:brain and acute leukemia cytoplasmic protein-like n=1 Tax=Rhinatrema bivittatum TaxID=194408 RepID=UPI00112A7F7B|nr:brain and acute leukemia cytoplasmic protein-like [Rhinatrema bivittatum]